MYHDTGVTIQFNEILYLYKQGDIVFHRLVFLVLSQLTSS